MSHACVCCLLSVILAVAVAICKSIKIKALKLNTNFFMWIRATLSTPSRTSAQMCLKMYCLEINR